MLVGSRLKIDIVSVLSFKSRNAVRQYNFVTVPDMRRTGSIRNCRCNIVFSLVHVSSSSFFMVPANFHWNKKRRLSSLRFGIY